MIEESFKNTAYQALARPGVSINGSSTATTKENPLAVESKAFADFIQQDYFPALTKGLADQGVTDLLVNLECSKIVIKGFEAAPECSQVIGYWNDNKYQFNIYFFDDNIQGQRAFSCSYREYTASTIEYFLILERKITLDLLILGLITRLNSQRWLLIC